MVEKEFVYTGICPHSDCGCFYKFITDNKFIPVEFSFTCPNCRFFGRRNSVFFELEEEHTLDSKHL